MNPTKQLLEDLKAARSLIATPEGWTQGCMARDRNNASVYADSPEAVSFCARGAVVRATNGYSLSTASRFTRALEYFKEYQYVIDITAVNDRSSHQDILRLFDRAIEDLTRRVLGTLIVP